MHKEVRIYCESVKKRFPEKFKNKDILECGSLDINGNNRYLFEGGLYCGIDICEGKNVDVVSRIHLYEPQATFDVIISTEMLEHDEYYRESLKKMFSLMRPNGLLLITAAGTGRPEHGTFEHHPGDSPKTQGYYQNVTVPMIVEGLDLEAFEWFEISYHKTDIRFAGIKR